MMDQLYKNKLDWGLQVSRGNILNAEVQHSLGHGADGHPAAAERMTGGRVKDKPSSARTGAQKTIFCVYGIKPPVSDASRARAKGIPKMLALSAYNSDYVKQPIE